MMNSPEDWLQWQLEQSPVFLFYGNGKLRDHYNLSTDVGSNYVNNQLSYRLETERQQRISL